jgi:hypothetical protein
MPTHLPTALSGAAATPITSVPKELTLKQPFLKTANPSPNPLLAPQAIDPADQPQNQPIYARQPSPGHHDMQKHTPSVHGCQGAASTRRPATPARAPSRTQRPDSEGKPPLPFAALGGRDVRLRPGRALYDVPSPTRHPCRSNRIVVGRRGPAPPGPARHQKTPSATPSA